MYSDQVSISFKSIASGDVSSGPIKLNATSENLFFTIFAACAYSLNPFSLSKREMHKNLMLPMGKFSTLYFSKSTPDPLTT